MYIYILLRWGLGGFSKVYLISKIVPSFIHLSKSESKPLFCGLTPPTITLFALNYITYKVDEMLRHFTKGNDTWK